MKLFLPLLLFPLVLFAIDSDSDSLDDAWENTHFGNLTSSDGTGDFENDDLSDLAEFIAGTNPTLSDSDGDSNPDGYEINNGTDPLDINSKTNRPNIIFIFADDMGYGDIGVLFQNAKSGKKHKTPFFDQMANDGMILDRHYCPAPVCAPSRASLMSGLHQGHANIRDNQFDKEFEDNHNLANTLKKAGYTTALIGKWGMQGSGSSPATWPAYPTKRGFDSFYGYVRHGDGHTHYPSHVTPSRGVKQLYDNDNEVSADLSKCFTPDLFTARAKKLITEEVNDGDQEPFFIYLAYDTPHAALQIPTVAYPGWNASDDDDDSGFGVSGGVQWTGTPGSMINTATGTIDSYKHPDYTGNGWTDVEERFATLVRRMDDCIGDLRKTLEDLGIADDTLIVFSSDNGPHNESYLPQNYSPQSFDSYGPFEGQKRDCWEGGIREPSFVVWPGTVTAGTTSTLHTQLHDWLPTFCQVAGITQPARTDGVNLLPTLTQTGTQKPPTTYIEYNVNSSTPNYNDFSNHGGDNRRQSQVIFLDHYKGIRRNPADATGDFEIYDTRTDLSEGTNLLNTSPYFTELNQRMKDRVLQLRQPNTTAARPWDNANVPQPTNLPSLIPGVHYATFTGLWSWVPEFTELTSSTSGDDRNVNLALLPPLPANQQSRGLLTTGYIHIPTSGTWNFSLESDSGAFLRIHDIIVTDDDYEHNGGKTTGSVLLEAGYHPYRIYYKNESGEAPSLSWQWSGPTVAEQIVPDSALFIEGVPDPIPVVADDAVSTTNGSPILINALNNDFDDGLPTTLSITAIGTPSYGTATLIGDTIQYTPTAPVFGTDTFTYTVTDGSNLVTGNISVTNYFQPSDFWIPLNECLGTTALEAAGYAVGTLSGFAAPNAAHIAGVHGKALRFDGSDDQINLTALTSLPTGSAPRTAMCWIRTNSGAALENQTMFGYGLNANGQRFTFRLNGGTGTTNQAVRLEVQGGSIVGSTSVSDGQWHHVAVVCDDFNNNGLLEVQETKIYVDGVADAIAAFSSRTIDTAANTIPVLGASNHATNYSFTGDIDEFRFFPTALSATEVATIANEPNNLSSAWHRQFFGDATPDWTADTDNDQLPRLLEYAFGADPLTPDAADFKPSVGFNSTTGKLSLTYNRRHLGTSNLTYTPQASSDLFNWSTLTTTETSSTPHSAIDCLEEVTVEADNTTLPKQFLRLKVEEN